MLAPSGIALANYAPRAFANDNARVLVLRNIKDPARVFAHHRDYIEFGRRVATRHVIGPKLPWWQLILLGYDVYELVSMMAGTPGGGAPDPSQVPEGANLPLDPAYWNPTTNPLPPADNWNVNGPAIVIYKNDFTSGSSIQPAHLVEPYVSPPGNYVEGDYPASYQWWYPVTSPFTPGQHYQSYNGSDRRATAPEGDGWTGPREGMASPLGTPGVRWINQGLNPNFMRNNGTAQDHRIVADEEIVGSSDRTIIVGSDFPGAVGGHMRTPPPRGTKEKKVRAEGLGLGVAIAKALDGLSEASEVVDAIYESLPDDVKRRWGKGRKERDFDQMGQYGIDGADWKLEALWHNWHKINAPEAVKNILYNELEDRLYGRAYAAKDKLQLRGKARKRRYERT